MKLNSLPKLTDKTKKRVGRGIGSGKGKTSGRGQKGQKVRGKIPAGFIGGTLPLYKKLPYVRGWSRSGGNPARSPKPVVVKLSQLNDLKANSTVSLQTLVASGIAKGDVAKRGVKILADSDVKVALTVEIPVSKKAQEKIEQAGGKVVL